MSTKNKIKTYNPKMFLDKFMPTDENSEILLKFDFGKFFIVKVEDMISLINLPVPPSRSINHTLIYLTKGQATMTIGSKDYRFGHPEFVKVGGMIHGTLFILFSISLFQTKLENSWNTKKALILFLLSLIPFGNFYSDVKIINTKIR